MAGLPLAVLIDGENVAATHLVSIMAKARELGNPTARCVVGDFSANRLAKWVRLAPADAIDLVFQPSCGKGRNSADIALTIRALDLLATNVFRRFLISSSDSDFTPLALRLGRSGAAVFGMGVAKPKSAWRAACTEFFDLHGQPTEAPEPGTISRQEAPATTPKPAAPKATTLKPTAAKPAASKPAAVKPTSPAARPAPSQQDLEAVRSIMRQETRADAPWLPLSEIGQLIRRHSSELSGRVCGNGRLLKNLRADDENVELNPQGTKARLCERSSPTQEPPRLRVVANTGDQNG